ncbi:hypothetical protein V6V47_15220 [Micromonospora sp. CPCC 205539]|uniref:hypothetical protein n=1 Tax=Micromonospora sp. CPCC 205539 TaxID=3122408 RepID=UPI002FF41CD2
MLDERQMGDLMLAEIESAERPSGVLNLDQAMTTGRRQRRQARGAGAVLLAAALAVGGLTVPDLLTAERPPATAPFGPGQTGPGQTGLPAALTTVDPQRVYVRFGWLPDGLRDLQYQAGLMLGGSGVYLGASNGQPNDARFVGVSLLPKGVQPSAPQRDSGEPASPTGTSNGPALNGGDSTFASYSGAEKPEAILRWRYAPDGWAQVRVFGMGPDARGIAAQVARSLRFGNDLVPMPATVPDVPAALRLIEVSVHESLDKPEDWYTRMTWSPEPATAEPRWQRARTLSVGVSRYRNVTDPADKAYVDPNTTLDGHPARFGGKDGNETLTVYDVDGATVSIDDSALLPAGGTRALFPKITLVAEPAAWHTHLHP